MSTEHRFREAVAPDHDDTSSAISELLEAARRHLGVDLAFLGEFVDDCEVYRTLAGDAASFGLSTDMALPLSDTYCQAMIDGRIDHVVADSALEPAVADLEVTTSGQIGRYIGVPVRLSDGRLYGALCGVGHGPDPNLRREDARVLEFLAELVAEEIDREQEATHRHRETLARITPLLSGSGLTMVFQPIVTLCDGQLAGFEALARFSREPWQGPELWFAHAFDVGLGVGLELTAIKAALAVLDQLPTDTYLSVNASAETALSPGFVDALRGVDLARVMLEITEHAVVTSYGSLSDTLRPLRAEGLRLAVDDAGAGVASLHHIVELAPELIKMDISLTRGIDTSPPRSALATALVSFAAATGASILAEGIETEAELATLCDLGVSYGQGYLLGRPAPLPVTAAGFQRSRPCEPRVEQAAS